ncbi:hypothetical protein ACA910_016976 [Epithemia clementina (nom. ined.)]
MAPRFGSSAVDKGAAPGTGYLLSPNDKWIPVTWMPHTNLSQTSHVSVKIRSAQVRRPPRCVGVSVTNRDNSGHDSYTFQDDEEDEWRVNVAICHGGGELLEDGGCVLGLSSQTHAAPVEPRSYQSATNLESLLQSIPRVSGCSHECHWETTVHMALRWRDIPRDSYLLFEVLDWDDSVMYRAILPFFSRYGRLLTGLHRVELSKQPLDPSQNYGLYSLARRSERNDEACIFIEKDPVWKASCILDQISRFEDKSINYGLFGAIPSVPWLDNWEKECCLKILANMEAEDQNWVEQNNELHGWLIVELPQSMCDIPIMHEETFYNTPTEGASGGVSPLDMALYRKRKSAQSTACSGLSHQGFEVLNLVAFLDYENENDNPVEDKYRTLAHDLLRGLVDPALKPDREQRVKLDAIIDSPSHHPTREEKDLLWRFRFSLVDNRRALTKFLLAVDWTVDSEVVQAVELLEQWRKRSPIEVTDALKLLGKHVAFQTNLVRSYAIDTLASAPDSELRLYLLQLVQALKYETLDASLESRAAGSTAERGDTQHSQEETIPVSSLANFLIHRAAGSLELANYLYWYLKVEKQSPTHGARYHQVFAALEERLSLTEFAPPGVFHVATQDDIVNSSSRQFRSIVDSVSKIGSSLLHSDNASTSGEAAPSSRKPSSKRTVWDVLVAQDKFITGVMDVQQRCRDTRGKKDAKETQLKSILAKEGFDRSPQRHAFPLPSAPNVLVNGLRPATAKMFKSALYPALVEFNVEAVLPWPTQEYSHPQNSTAGYKVIVKTGDDLRQDQLIIMMIQLMDGLLKRAALDLCLTPYSVIAMSPTSGLVEFVDGSIPISQILTNHGGSIMQFFQSTAPENGAKYDVRPETMATYVRSCAGYCVITYILGVGDRHLDNILLRSSGHFFHIDFGFVFGRDPKPLPPAFRLTREMVEGMGGIDSAEYRQFCSLSCQAFNAIRKSAGLVLNLLHLMGDAGIEDLSNNPSSNVEGVIAKVEERFRLDLDNEQAERYFRGLISDCLAAIAPRVMDVFHSFAVARR